MAAATVTPTIGDRVWAASRPALVLLASAMLGIIAAVLCRTFLFQLLDQLVAFVRGVAALIQRLTGVAAPEIPTRKWSEVDLGLGALGATVIIATVRETSSAIDELLKGWMNPERSVLAKAGLAVGVAFMALGLSVYGLLEIKRPVASTAITFQSEKFPLAAMEPATGHLTFFIPFLAEGGEDTFTEPDHASVTVGASDREFLLMLGRALHSCGSPSRPVRISVRGFASSSLWDTNGELALVRPADPAQREKLEDAKRAVDQVVSAEGIQHPGSDPAIARGHAFNVYLANRRREAVLNELTPNPVTAADPAPTLVVEGGPWTTFEEMQDAIAIDDSKGSPADIPIKGVLTRSVGVTVKDAASCAQQLNLDQATVSVQASG